MSNIHVLDGQGNTYRAVIHINVPVENNLVNVALRTALVNSGLAVTVMTTGSASGQISPTELSQIQAGQVYEITFDFQNDPNWTTQQRQTNFNNEVSNRQAAGLTDLRLRLAYFGYTQ